MRSALRGARGPAAPGGLLRLAEKGPSSVGDPLQFRTIDRQFHGAIYSGAGNAFLEATAIGLFAIALDLRRSLMLLPSLLTRSCEDHTRIAEAIARRDADAAVEAYRGHLLNVCDTTIRVLATQPNETVP